MSRKLFTLAAGVSAVLCVAAGVLWVRSCWATPGEEDRVSWFVAGRRVRYTVRSTAGRLVLFAPPAAPPRAEPANWWERLTPDVEPPGVLADRLENGQLWWQGRRALNWRPPEFAAGQASGPSTDSPRLVRDTPAELMLSRYIPTAASRRGWYTRAELLPPLLAGLESEERFAVAHVLLTRVSGTPITFGWEPRPDGSFVHDFNGLRVELTVKPGDPIVENSYGDETQWLNCAARFDPAQLPALRNQWHWKLDVPLGAVPYWTIVAATGALPALWFGAAVLRRLRRRPPGHCPACGYDLRATPDRCPECGAVPAAKGERA